MTKMVFVGMQAPEVGGSEKVAPPFKTQPKEVSRTFPIKQWLSPELLSKVSTQKIERIFCPK